MINIIHKLFGTAIKKRLSEGYFKPQTLKDLRFAYTGPDGRAYYTWDDVSLMPACRVKRIEGTMLWADAGIGSKRLEELCSMIDTAIMDAVRAKNDAERSKALARATKLNGEIQTRQRNVIPEEVYYDLAALTIAREDEDPTTIDPDIHNQKRAMLREAGRAGASFFASMSAFRSVLRSSLTTEDALNALLLNWSQQEAEWKARKEVYTSQSEPTATPKSSTTSPSGSQKGTFFDSTN